jgi:hypothetical protein
VPESRVCQACPFRIKVGHDRFGNHKDLGEPLFQVLITGLWVVFHSWMIRSCVKQNRRYRGDNPENWEVRSRTHQGNSSTRTKQARTKMLVKLECDKRPLWLIQARLAKSAIL